MERLRAVHGRDLRSLTAKHILQQINAVHAHIHQRASAALRLFLPPRAGNIRIPAGKLRIGGYRLADFSLGNGLFHRLNAGAEAHHKARRDQHVLLLAVLDDLLAICRRHCQRLFDQDVFARVCRSHRLLCVQKNRGRDIDRVDLRIVQQFLRRRIRFFAVPFRAAAFRQLRRNLHDGDQLCIFTLHHTGDRPTLGNAACADDAPTNLFHSYVSSLAYGSRFLAAILG